VSGPRPRDKRAFAAAVHALAEEPTTANVVRYLMASRELEARRAPALRPELVAAASHMVDAAT
jgi:hypothetical protein